MAGLFPWAGGIRLDPCKQESSRHGLRVASIPPQLVFPLLQRNGRNARPLVAAGERVRRGQPIAAPDDPLLAPILASTSGVIGAIEERPLPHPSGLSGACIVLDADGRDEAVDLPPPCDHIALPIAEQRRRIHAAGIVGMGGAGFPTALKLDPGGLREIDTLVLNGAECEPYITCDDSLMRLFPADVLAGGAILMGILQARRCLLGIEADRAEAIAALESVRASGGFAGIEIVPVPAVYPAGGEKQLIRLLTGREVPAAGIPADAGVVCQNVATAAAVYRAVACGEPLLSRIVTVTGPGVRRPDNWLTRIGTPVAHLIEHGGGYTESARRLILGGPMMGVAVASDLVPVGRETGCVLVLDGVAAAAPTLPCIRCGACADVCPIRLLPQQLYWHAQADNLRRATEYGLDDCIECGCCDFVCPSRIPLVQWFRSAKGELAAQQQARRVADHARARFEARQRRQQREQQERAESARRKKEILLRASGAPAEADGESAAAEKSGMD